MNKNVAKYKIIIEIPCTECSGDGEFVLQNDDIRTCSDCDGTGYEELKITLLALKNLLDGGIL